MTDLEEFLLEFSVTRSARIKVRSTSRVEAEAIGRDAAVEYINQMAGAVEPGDLLVEELSLEHEVDWYDKSIETDFTDDEGGYIVLDEEA